MVNIKRKLGILAISILGFSMTACSNQQETGIINESKIAILEEETDRAIEEQQLSNEVNDEKFPLYEISNAESTIYYEGENFIKSVFRTGGEMVYIYGIKEDGTYFFGEMKKEEKILNEISLEIPEDMYIINMVVDFYGDCHILWTSVEEIELNGTKASQMTFEKSLIMKVGKDGNIAYTIDISEIVKEKSSRPFCFTIDKNGNYYFDKSNDINEIIKINADGNLYDCITCEGGIEAVGSGMSGTVYCIYMDENGVEMLGRLEKNTIVSCDIVLPSVEARYSDISIGTDTELLIYNKESGVFAYDSNTNTLEQRIQGGELPVYGENVEGHGFLGDGRLCLMSQDESGKVFHYIPAGK